MTRARVVEIEPEPCHAAVGLCEAQAAESDDEFLIAYGCDWGH